MMIRGNDTANIKVGVTLSTDEFSHIRFDFMLSNPPYGKSWASEQSTSNIAVMPHPPTLKRWSAAVPDEDAQQDEIPIDQTAWE